MEHKNAYLPYFKDDARFRETIKKETRVIAQRPVYKGLTEEQRRESIAGLHPTIRPRPLFGDPPPMVSSSMAATIETGLGLSCATATGSWECLSGGGAGSPKTSPKRHLSGLRGRPELNGAACEVVDAAPDSAGRITVRLSSEPSGAAAGKLMRVRASYLAEGGRRPELGRSLSTSELPSADSPIRPLPVPKCRRSFSRKPTGGYFNHSLGMELWNSPLV